MKKQHWHSTPRRFTFEMQNPSGTRDEPLQVEFDLRDLLDRRAVTLRFVPRFVGGRTLDWPVIQFAWPFADLQVEHRETLTREKAVYLKAALRSFGKIPISLE